MAKRHKHFNSNKTKGNVKSKSKRTGKNKQMRRTGQTAKKKFLPIGGGDLMNPDMVEDYFFGQHKKKNTLKSGGLRPGRVMDDDLQDIRLPLRHRPVEFIKAKEIYDPSHDLILKLIEKNKEIDDSNTIETSKESLEEMSINSSAIATEDFSEESIGESERECQTHELSNGSTQNKQSDSIEREKNLNDDAIDNNEIFYVDLDGDNTVNTDSYKKLLTESEDETEADDEADEEEEEENLCTTFEPILKVGNVELNLKRLGNDSIEVKKPKGSYHPFYQYVQNVMKNVQENSSDEYSSDEENEINEYKQPLLSQQKMQKISTGIGSYTSYHENHNIKRSNLDQCDNSMKSLTIEDQVMKTANLEPENKVITDNDGSPSKKEPEFGFCEEDFASSIGKIFVSNIRLGLNDRSYQISCQDIYGDSTLRWVDQETMCDLAGEMGLPEHRLAAYFKHLYDSLLEKNSNSSVFSDIPFEDSETDESEKAESVESDLQDVGENLDDLIEYTLKYSEDRNQIYDTSPLKVRGKRRNKQLIFDDDTSLDNETRLMLQDKFTNRETNKTKKRRTKEDFIAAAFNNSLDLLEKYPYGLHIQNIKDEFESFYHSNRKSITFPPLDPHGNKVVGKFAYNYFMKSTVISRGKSTKVYVEKTRKTKYNQPAYHIINQLLRQRPVFMRIDRKVPSEESSTFNRTVRLKVPKAKFNITEGQVVGEDAPEIGSDNVGRRMLEKLGWNTGQGLGAQGNKGIQEPILAKVKKSKSGLRHT